MGKTFVLGAAAALALAWGGGAVAQVAGKTYQAHVIHQVSCTPTPGHPCPPVGPTLNFVVPDTPPPSPPPPDPNPVPGGPFTVGGSGGSVVYGNQTLFFNVTYDKIIFTAGSTGFDFGPSTINGIELDFTPDPYIVKVTYDPTSTAPTGPGDIVFPTGGVAALPGVAGAAFLFGTESWGAGQTGIFDLAFAGGVVPEPATWAMMLLGFASIGALARRRAKTTATVG